MSISFIPAGLIRTSAIIAAAFFAVPAVAEAEKTPDLESITWQFESMKQTLAGDPARMEKQTCWLLGYYLANDGVRADPTILREMQGMAASVNCHSIQEKIAGLLPEPSSAGDTAPAMTDRSRFDGMTRDEICFLLTSEWNYRYADSLDHETYRQFHALSFDMGCFDLAAWVHDQAGLGGDQDTAQAAYDCEDLWFERNAIYQRYGYCFTSARARATFDTTGCTTSSPILSAQDQGTVDYIRRLEREMSCR